MGDSIARVLVVGDSGVGKTSLVHKLCYGEVLNNPEWTVGCNVEVKYCPTDGDVPAGFVDFLDVGCHNNHSMSRSIFYNGIDGVILVYDMSNSKSFTNLKKWIAELRKSVTKGDYSNEKRVESTIFQRSIMGQPPTNPSGDDGTICGLPVLVIGNKLDLVRGWRASKIPNVQRSLGYDSINASSVQFGEIELSGKYANFIRRAIELNGSHGHGSARGGLAYTGVGSFDVEGGFEPPVSSQGSSFFDRFSFSSKSK
eukprot:CAMPEP_0203763742 /NCGR_PEP_ID=MMETSP0098-20131031/16785_1 /ASSEMBLY_ACC=CAM_ASM_000208 /TAXON_ID=96639 /ORGANISM=" , Strain NY0313808BC1" /LENGTH=254 /DNA_ID=CAMNT_0050658919 /DNA_START=260 /DNA_END=1024 /DNA_ORIENTATION=-